jgi:hypothetical protein
MAIFGSSRDISTFKGISRELLENVVSQNCGYYKIVLKDTEINVYGEGMTKYYVGPVLINCLIERGDFTANKEDFGVQVSRNVQFRFLKYHLEQANVVPEVGDVIMYNEDYYHVGNVNENQLIVGKDNDYSYESGLQNFGNSYSILLDTHLTSPDALGITKNRL